MKVRRTTRQIVAVIATLLVLVSSVVAGAPAEAATRYMLRDAPQGAWLSPGGYRNVTQNSANLYAAQSLTFFVARVSTVDRNGVLRYSAQSSVTVSTTHPRIYGAPRCGWYPANGAQYSPTPISCSYTP